MLIKIIGLLFLVLASLQAFSAETPDEENTRYHSFRPCTFWNYKSGESVCGSVGMMINVPDAQETARELEALRTQVRELEARVKKLENGE